MVLPIVKYPTAVLRAKCRTIEMVEERHRQLAADMIETMHEANGVGLAAPQVAVDERIAVIDASAGIDEVTDAVARLVESRFPRFVP